MACPNANYEMSLKTITEKLLISVFCFLCLLISDMTRPIAYNLISTHCLSLPLPFSHCLSLSFIVSHCLSLPLPSSHFPSLSLIMTADRDGNRGAAVDDIFRYSLRKTPFSLVFFSASTVIHSSAEL